MFLDSIRSTKSKRLRKGDVVLLGLWYDIKIAPGCVYGCKDSSWLNIRNFVYILRSRRNIKLLKIQLVNTKKDLGQNDNKFYFKIVILSIYNKINLLNLYPYKILMTTFLLYLHIHIKTLISRLQRQKRFTSIIHIHQMHLITNPALVVPRSTMALICMHHFGRIPT